MLLIRFGYWPLFEKRDCAQTGLSERKKSSLKMCEQTFVTAQLSIFVTRAAVVFFPLFSLLDLMHNQKCYIRIWTGTIACVASVSVGFGKNERPRNGIFAVLPARKMGRKLEKLHLFAPQPHGNACYAGYGHGYLNYEAFQGGVVLSPCRILLCTFVA